MTSRYADVLAVYTGSDGDATKALYTEIGPTPLGRIVVNLFRACKASERAKIYRGGQRGRGSFRSMAYDRKQWAMDNLCAALAEHSDGLFIWGWGVDDKQEFHRHVLYVDLPGIGQISFHTASRGLGPDYSRGWDGVREQSADRICRFVAQYLQGRVVTMVGAS